MESVRGSDLGTRDSQRSTRFEKASLWDIVWELVLDVKKAPAESAGPGEWRFAKLALCASALWEKDV